MTQQVLGQPTADVVRKLQEAGIHRQVLLMRHSARNYSGDPRMEPFMGLTDKGQAAAQHLGSFLGDALPVTPASSYIGRCIETSYLLQQGSGCRAGLINTLEERLSPFYVYDFEKIIDIIIEHDLFTFIRNWCDGAFPAEVIGSAHDAARTMVGFAEERLEGGEPGLFTGITHDWNIFALKEYALKCPHETWGKVDYLEGVVFYKEGETLMAVSHQADARAVDETLLVESLETVSHG